MPTNSFDIVSQIDLQEVNNAVHQAGKEIRTRYDLKSSNSSIELDQAESKIRGPSPGRFHPALGRRGPGTKTRSPEGSSQRPGSRRAAAGRRVVARSRDPLATRNPIEKAREIVKLIKNAKLKVQSSIQGDQVRVSAKKRDDLQSVIAMVKERDFDMHLEFTNYRTN